MNRNQFDPDKQRFLLIRRLPSHERASTAINAQRAYDRSRWAAGHARCTEKNYITNIPSTVQTAGADPGF